MVVFLLFCAVWHVLFVAFSVAIHSSASNRVALTCNRFRKQWWDWASDDTLVLIGGTGSSDGSFYDDKDQFDLWFLNVTSGNWQSPYPCQQTAQVR